MLSPNCKEVTRLQFDSIDWKLSPFQRVGLRLHLVLCKWCRRNGSQVKVLRSAAQYCEEQQGADVPQKLSSSARARIWARLQSSQQ
jgi:hypothetical protein